jgi:hypothetical protein
MLGLTLALALAAAPPDAGAAPPRLAFEGMLVPTARELRPSPKVKALAGHRVTLVGYMAKLEVAPRGAFYLTPTPVVCDEAGAGTADLPPNAVFVVVRSLQGETVPWTPRLLELTGVLEVGAREEPDGRATHLRLILDRAEDLGAAPVPAVVLPRPKENTP